MSDFTNGLTPAEAERLAILAEECGEVVQIAMKILRHGKAYHPISNSGLLARELGHVQWIVNLMINNGDFEYGVLLQSERLKPERSRTYLHHQEDL
jgi:hypothetical protein